jgi:hypothetical protein
MISDKLVLVEKDMAHLLDPANGFSFDHTEAASCALARHNLHPSETFEIVPGHRISVEQAVLTLFNIRRGTY